MMSGDIGRKCLVVSVGTPAPNSKRNKDATHVHVDDGHRLSDMPSVLCIVTLTKCQKSPF